MLRRKRVWPGGTSDTQECNSLLRYSSFNTGREQRSLVVLFILHFQLHGRVVCKSPDLGLDLPMSNFKLLMGKLEHCF